MVARGGRGAWRPLLLLQPEQREEQWPYVGSG